MPLFPSDFPNPWHINDHQIVYDNPWIRLDEYQVTNASGKPGIYGKVHFKNLAVGVVPYEKGHVWLVGQYRFTLEQYSWEIPAGGGNPKEGPLIAAQRELEEETGLIAQIYEPLLTMHLSNSVSDEWGIIYLATDLQQGEAQPDPTEQLEVQKVPLEQFFQAVESGEITDSLSVAAAYKLMLLWERGNLPV